MTAPRPLDGRVAIVTGAGRGLGRAHAIHLAQLGAAVVVNDHEVGPDGTPLAESAAAEVVGEVVSSGGRALTAAGDCGDFDVADRLVAEALDAFGRLDIVVNNAGILRDRMIFNMDAEDWDRVVHVHLRGHAAPLRAAARHWREASRRAGAPVGGRVVNTVSESGLYGNAGQTNYSAAKAGIAALTQAAARELERYGVTVNAVAPRARTRMVEHTWGTDGAAFGDFRADQVAGVVGWLASDRAADVTGQVLTVFGDTVQLMQGWHPASAVSRPGGFTVETMAGAADELFAGRARGIGPFPFDPQVVAAD
ncbi:SDR family NAD(P)-dependent oxidoreductase [Nocardioides marmotae]|uniref:SDR family NAD(P)-dependent oxidoreductase n=1 Tax=Nocardioides marmotae TaxID=2663857 RepID=UPI001320D41C|nr:SDR family NAD(P)-dependent oxidoreductase [Nocardioides marmotae]MBC9734313.1 SDR family NAD(P)-dependent oxidoreductase [Nocardioides marmotae]MTB85414.1 SDR family NAD(P)-dependent oxidoreductase [Nocardioides marmotae]